MTKKTENSSGSAQKPKSGSGSSTGNPGTRSGGGGTTKGSIN
ncbi:MAG: hypothetical protein QM488_19600 [Rhizobiaceae bacterium]